MPTLDNSQSAAEAVHPGDHRPVGAELQFLLIAIVFVVMMLLAGVPGREKKAGDGSAALQLGWAERHAAAVAAQQAADAEATPTQALTEPEGSR